MNIEALLARLQENVLDVAKPVEVMIDGLGTLHVRKRTILEFEQMATLKPGAEGAETTGVFAPSLTRLLCDENGTRFPAQHEKALAELLAKQPESVFHAIIEAADGKLNKKATEPGN